MTSQEKALKELIEINFVKMMDGVPVRSSIGMVEKDCQKFLIESVFKLKISITKMIVKR